MTQPFLDIYIIYGTDYQSLFKEYLHTVQYTLMHAHGQAICVNIEIDNMYIYILLYAYITIFISSLDMIFVYLYMYVRDMYFIIWSTYCVPFM